MIKLEGREGIQRTGEQVCKQRPYYPSSLSSVLLRPLLYSMQPVCWADCVCGGLTVDVAGSLCKVHPVASTKG